MIRSFLTVLSLAILTGCTSPAPPTPAPSAPPGAKARNVILFIADGTGIPTLNATSIYAHEKALGLFVYSLHHLALSECSANNNWVSDSAAGMTAIVTGTKTNNGVISQGPDAVRGKVDGAPLKTILEYAEERGLATGVVSNVSMADATPAACYAHANDRDKKGEIFIQVLTPRFGDGVDVVIGPGRDDILAKTLALGVDMKDGLAKAGYRFAENQEETQAAAASVSKLVALYGSDPFDLAVSVKEALRILSRNPTGYFLMVESNNHSTNIKETLENMARMDEIVQETVTNLQGTDTLVLFTADHSYAIRIPTAPKDKPILDFVEVEDTHTAEEVLVTATGPGSEAVRGVFPNTQLFSIMMQAYGWQAGEGKGN